jgi:hypothetical protein
VLLSDPPGLAGRELLQAEDRRARRAEATRAGIRIEAMVTSSKTDIPDLDRIRP